MKLDDLKQDWQKNIEQVSAPENLNKVIKMLEKETTKIDKEIKRRDFLEISIAVLLIPVWIFGLFISKGSIQTVGYIFAIVSCIYIPYKLISAKKVTAPKLSNIKAFLEREHHRVQFVFTPKHCSWLNPIENWFAKLQRQVIKNGNFFSVNELNEKIEKYISKVYTFLINKKNRLT